jgi:predicted nucleic acid-binding protein
LKVGLDTSFIVHLLRQRTPEHAVTLDCYLAHKAARDEFVLTDHVLFESFAVLSRAPARIGLRPSDAARLLSTEFEQCEIAPLHPGIGWEAIQHMLARGFWGGRIYDAAIALATAGAGASLLLTWNIRHFVSIAPPGLEIRAPDALAGGPAGGV